MKINIEGKVWILYLNLYNGPKLTGQEIKYEDKVDNNLNYNILKEKFDKAL